MATAAADERGRQPLPKAAKAIGKSRTYVRGLVNDGKLTAYKVGGTPERPWLEVDVAELRAVHDEESRYVPPGQRTRNPPRRPVRLNPATAGMR